jgi:hypothetical protein
MGIAGRQEGITKRRTLILEDEFTGRRLLQSRLSPYGECRIAWPSRAEVPKAYGVRKTPAGWEQDFPGARTAMKSAARARTASPSTP